MADNPEAPTITDGPNNLKYVYGKYWFPIPGSIPGSTILLPLVHINQDGPETVAVPLLDTANPRVAEFAQAVMVGLLQREINASVILEPPNLTRSEGFIPLAVTEVFGGKPNTPIVKLIGADTKEDVEILTQGGLYVSYTDVLEKQRFVGLPRVTVEAIRESGGKVIFAGKMTDSAVFAATQQLLLEALGKRQLRGVFLAHQMTLDAAWYGNINAVGLLLPRITGLPSDTLVNIQQGEEIPPARVR